MELQSDRHLPLPRQLVWDALNDPAVLRHCIPGCESMDVIDEAKYEAVVLAKVGPVKARFRGHVTIADHVPPERYTLVFEGQGGAAGFARGEAEVMLLHSDDGASILIYSARATVGGKLAQIGSRLVQATARKLADDFFDNFVARLQPSDGASAESAPPSPTAEETKKRNWKFWTNANQSTE